jgi:predicted O-methyltransferase YrrM
MNRAWEMLRRGAEGALRSVWQTQDHRALIRVLLAQLEPPRGRRAVFVETGCGLSTLALAEAARELDAFVYSCDLNEEKIAALRERLGDAIVHVQFLIGDSLTSVAQVAARHSSSTRSWTPRRPRPTRCAVPDARAALAPARAC